MYISTVPGRRDHINDMVRTVEYARHVNRNHSQMFALYRMLGVFALVQTLALVL